MSAQKHSFAFFYPFKEKIQVKSELTITDPTLCHRLFSVLHLKINDECILFDAQYHIQALITSITQKHVTFFIASLQPNTPHKPLITCILPLLKRDALEKSVDFLTQTGASTIQLVITKKIHRAGFTHKDFIRLQKIIIAAAEQSKNFSFPQLHMPITLEDFLKTYNVQNVGLFFDAQGEPAFRIMQHIKSNKPNTLFLMIGPEGDLHEEEKRLLKNYNFSLVALTPTILRAEVAISVATAMIRSLCS
jgi:16S rRNA (uracil1498-N3)-methyltransferase